MKINLGFLEWDGTEFNWDLKESSNFHGIITGPSGSGKTYTLSKIITKLAQVPTIERVYVFDVHGDISENVPSDLYSKVDFSEASGNGINLLEISPNKEYGGPRKKIMDVVKTINRTSSGSLGSRQVASLSRYLKGLYASKGIKIKDSSTWNKPSPTLVDLRKFLENSLTAMKISADIKSAHALNEVLSAARRIAAAAKTEDPDIQEAELEENKEKAKAFYKEFINSITDGSEMEAIEGMKKNVEKMVESLLDRIQILEDAGVFNGNSLSFNPAKKVYMFDLKTLTYDEKIVFIDTMTRKIHDHAISKGLIDRAREIIVIDEANEIIDPNDKDSIYNRVVLGMRKYGLGMILGSQAIHHFSDDVLMNTAMKIILGVDSIFTKQVASKIGEKENMLKYLKPKVSALAFVKSKDPSAPIGWKKIVFNKKDVKK